MINSKKLIWLLILSTALTISACSGGETNNTQQVTNVENNTSSSDASESVPDKAIKAATGNKGNYDILAENFLLQIGDMRETFAVVHILDAYKPPAQCFNYWHKRGASAPTSEKKDECKNWTEELAHVYGSYGYKTPADTFKSEFFWKSVQTWADENYTKESASARENNTVSPNCVRAPQKGYNYTELIPDIEKSRSCLKFEKN